MLAIEPIGLDSAQEELASVRVGSGVGHGQDTGAGVLELEVLVLEFVSVDGLSSGAVVPGEVTTLAHELRDHAVEGAALVAEAFLSSAQGPEVLAVLGTTSARRVISMRPSGAPSAVMSK